MRRFGALNTRFIEFVSALWGDLTIFLAYYFATLFLLLSSAQKINHKSLSAKKHGSWCLFMTAKFIGFSVCLRHRNDFLSSAVVFGIGFKLKGIINFLVRS